VLRPLRIRAHRPPRRPRRRSPRCVPADGLHNRSRQTSARRRRTTAV